MLSAVKRYSVKAFPAYRFVPGVNPHPVEDPRGHSFGKEETAAQILMEDNWSKNEEYLYGIDLYNYGYWWESHEAWEGLWKEFPRNDITAQFLQGLIKASAAFLKWHMKERGGAALLFSEAKGHLQKARAINQVYMGIDLKGHLTKLEKHFSPILQNPPELPNLFIDYPFIELQAGL